MAENLLGQANPGALPERLWGELRKVDTGRSTLDEDAIRDFLASDYGSLVANLALVTGSRDEAEDAVQEALVRAWIESEKGQEIVSVRAWVGVVALNLVRSRFRRLRVERRASGLLGSIPESADPAPTPGTEEAADVTALVQALPRRQREVVVLRYYLGLRVDEVAAALGISEGTAKKALHRARTSVGRSLEGEKHVAGR